MSNLPTIRIDGTNTQRVTEAKILGITITSNLTWDIHIDEITRKAGKRLFLLLQLKRSGIPVENILTVYMTLGRSTLEHAWPARTGRSHQRWVSKMFWSEYKDYEHHNFIPEHTLYRSISECTADFSKRETCAIM